MHHTETPKMEGATSDGDEVRGWDIVILDPRRFHCNCKTDRIQRLIQTHSDASSQLLTLGIFPVEEI